MKRPEGRGGPLDFRRETRPPKSDDGAIGCPWGVWESQVTVQVTEVTEDMSTKDAPGGISLSPAPGGGEGSLQVQRQERGREPLAVFGEQAVVLLSWCAEWRELKTSRATHLGSNSAAGWLSHGAGGEA